jgi:hypothetical protein
MLMEFGKYRGCQIEDVPLSYLARVLEGIADREPSVLRSRDLSQNRYGTYRRRSSSAFWSD